MLPGLEGTCLRNSALWIQVISETLSFVLRWRWSKITIRKCLIENLPPNSMLYFPFPLLLFISDFWPSVWEPRFPWAWPKIDCFKNIIHEAAITNKYFCCTTVVSVYFEVATTLNCSATLIYKGIKGWISAGWWQSATVTFYRSVSSHTRVWLTILSKMIRLWAGCPSEYYLAGYLTTCALLCFQAWDPAESPSERTSSPTTPSASPWASRAPGAGGGDPGLRRWGARGPSRLLQRSDRESTKPISSNPIQGLVCHTPLQSDSPVSAPVCKFLLCPPTVLKAIKMTWMIVVTQVSQGYLLDIQVLCSGCAVGLIFITQPC